MAEIIKVGEKVQAVDELGRWCDGKVRRINDDTTVFITFRGFPDDDSIVMGSNVRRPVLPYEQQERESQQKVKEIRSKRRQPWNVSREQRNFFLQCQRDDDIQTIDGVKTVAVVDPFNRTIEASDGTIISVNSIILPKAHTIDSEDEDDLLPPKPKRRVKKDQAGKQLKKHQRRKQLIVERSVTMSREQSPSTSTRESSREFVQAEFAEQPTESQPQHGVKRSDGLVHRLGQYICGEVYLATDLSIDLMVKELDIFQETAVGMVLKDDRLLEDTTIRLPTSKLNQDSKSTKGQVRKIGNQLKKEAFERTTNNMHNAKYRHRYIELHRKNAISTALTKVFAGRASNRLFDLGYVAPGVDNLFTSFPETSITYSYKNKNLHVLDDLLGKEWDTCVANGLTKFVTSLKFHVGRMDQLSGNVKIAEYPGESSCRKTLQAFILS